ncbi:IQ motif and SEC7 domain-containing protein 2-like isoform X2 [Sycon ciliatum]|uniref:IQ motif and SEC7 domain-containing protein 2-like isoform X2 n=1 Tax=Sycon ciliatum TaxID=27933 RepID=UPI0031F64264
MAESNSELILTQLDELRSAVLQQDKYEKQLERQVEELKAEVLRLNGIIAELQHGLPPPRSPEARNGHPAGRPLKVRSVPAHSQSVQAYNNLQRRSSGELAVQQQQLGTSTSSQQGLSRSQSASGHISDKAASLPGANLPTSRTTSFGSFSETDSGTASMGVSSTTLATSTSDVRSRSGSKSRSRDDSFSQRRPSSSSINDTRSHSTDGPEYVLSPDMEQKRSERAVVDICRRYGGNLRTQRAARTIQRAFREHALKRRHAHHRQMRASRLYSTPPTMEQLKQSGLSPKQHRWISESKSMHRPVQRTAISPAMSAGTMSNGESMDSMVGMSEIVVVMPEPEQLSTDVSMGGPDGGMNSETSSINTRSSPGNSSGEDKTSANGVHSGAVSPVSIASSASPSPGIDTGGQFEVMRRASFAVKPSDSKLKRQRQLRIGITHFNRKPSKGIQYLIGKGLLQDDTKSVAVFLKKQGGLSRQMIGEYLGNLQSGFNQAVLLDFVNQFNLQSEAFTMALRKFLSTFRLPGEAQKIERILQVFANRFAECNPEHDLSADTVFVLAFSTIMLNTDLHNSSVKQHMTKEEFVRNNRGINNGEDIRRDFLDAIYEDVSEREFKTSKDHVQQVLSLEKTITGRGQSPRLSQPHRQLVHVARMIEVLDKDKKQAPNQHSRFLFLFNDMLLIAKYAPKKNNGWTYMYKNSLPLLGMKVQEFSNQYYKRGVQIMTNFEGKVMLTVNGEKEETKKNFVRDLREVMAEIVEMEEERIQEMEHVSQRSKSSDLSPETARRSALAQQQQQQQQQQGQLSSGASHVSSSVPANTKGNHLGQAQTLMPIMEGSNSAKRASSGNVSVRSSGSPSSQRRALSSSDVRVEEPTTSPTPPSNQRPASNVEDHSMLTEGRESGSSSSWRAKLSGKRRKPGGPHLP